MRGKFWRFGFYDLEGRSHSFKTELVICSLHAWLRDEFTVDGFLFDERLQDVEVFEFEVTD